MGANDYRRTEIDLRPPSAGDMGALRTDNRQRSRSRVGTIGPDVKFSVFTCPVFNTSAARRPAVSATAPA